MSTAHDNKTAKAMTGAQHLAHKTWADAAKAGHKTWVLDADVFTFLGKTAQLAAGLAVRAAA